MNDLLVLVPDRNTEQAITGLLARPAALGIRQILHQILVHPGRDPGCAHRAHEFLRSFNRLAQHAMVVFDHAGCGVEQTPAHELAEAVRERLERNGWAGRAEVVVLSPELEVWVWSRSPHVEACLGWTNHTPNLMSWLRENGHWPEDAPKPPRPKEALEAALYHVRRPRSAAIYGELARRVSLRGHTEPAFVRFVSTLRRWFPEVPTRRGQVGRD